MAASSCCAGSSGGEGWERESEGDAARADLQRGVRSARRAAAAGVTGNDDGGDDDDDGEGAGRWEQSQVTSGGREGWEKESVGVAREWIAHPVNSIALTRQ